MNSWQQYFSEPENLNNLIAGLALIISFISTAFALRAVALQREHNRISVKPLPDFIFGDYENEIKVKIHNHGLGPMIIDKIEVMENSSVIGNNLIDLMPIHPKAIPWEDFVRNLEGRILSPGEEKVLILLSGNPKNRSFITFRDKVRAKLALLTVRIHYKGIYDKSVLVYDKALEKWFPKR
jgi:hypothetical protein